MADRRRHSARPRVLRTAQASRLIEPVPETAHIELRIWLRLLGISNQIKQRLASRLRIEFKTSMARFDLMAQLERAGSENLSMSALSDRVMVTNGAVTGLVDGLVRDGMVARETHPRDRRTVLVRLTPIGRRRFLKMARSHEKWVVELLKGVSPALMNRLHGHLALIKGHVRKSGA